MDLLFKRYASPYLLIDDLIKNLQYADFIDTLFDSIDTEKTWDFYLHKIDGQSFEDFKQNLKPPLKVGKIDLETTVDESYNIMQNFVPND